MTEPVRPAERPPDPADRVASEALWTRLTTAVASIEALEAERETLQAEVARLMTRITELEARCE